MDTINSQLVLIGSLPRSGSAWLSAALNTHPDAFFLHEGIVYYKDPIAWLEGTEYGTVGDIGSHCMLPELDRKKAKRIFLTRNKDNVVGSLKSFLTLEDPEYVVDEILSLSEGWLEKHEPYILSYEELFKKETLKDLWTFIFGEEPDSDKLDQMLRFNVQVHKPSEELQRLLDFAF